MMDDAFPADPDASVGLIEAAQNAGELRRDLDPEAALDLLAGPLLARVFAGLDVGPRWRDRAFATWWSIVRPPSTHSEWGPRARWRRTPAVPVRRPAP